MLRNENEIFAAQNTRRTILLHEAAEINPEFTNGVVNAALSAGGAPIGMTTTTFASVRDCDYAKPSARRMESNRYTHVEPRTHWQNHRVYVFELTHTYTLLFSLLGVGKIKTSLRPLLGTSKATGTKFRIPRNMSRLSNYCYTPD